MGIIRPSLVGHWRVGGDYANKESKIPKPTLNPLRHAWDDNALWVSGVTSLAITAVDGGSGCHCAWGVVDLCLYIETKRGSPYVLL